MAYPYLIQGQNIVVVIDNKPHTINKSHITYEKVLAAIKAGKWDEVKDNVEPKKAVLKFGAGNITIDGETFFWRGKPLHSSLATRMISMLKEGFDVAPLANLMENLMANPSKRAVDELYGFLEVANLPITPDGHFLAYKKIRNNWKDIYTNTMDNSVGKVLEMERNTVDDNKDVTCSQGLHFCSISYLPKFGSHSGDDRVVILKINPRDVVSIPSDYNNAKGRACRYTVISELAVAPENAFVKSVQETAVGNTPLPTAPSAVKPAAGTKVADAPHQDYDRFGNALSMTPSAIRKRKARANAKVEAQKAADRQAKLAASTTICSWPKPKV